MGPTSRRLPTGARCSHATGGDSDRTARPTTLVLRGYLERSVDPDDRRRVLVALTDRGHAASAVVFATVEQIDARLVAIVGAERMAHTKETLVALLSLRASASPSS
jgi:hypothetical protein